MQVSASSIQRQQRWPELAASARYHPGELAAQCGVSLRQLERYFIEDYQCCPQDWLRKYRMRAARALMIQKECVKEVSYDLGFKQSSHFCNEFKRWHGITPTQYLNDHKPQELPPDCMSPGQISKPTGGRN